MNYSHIYLIILLLIGFISYFNLKDFIFNTADSFDTPILQNGSSIEYSKLPSYPERNISPGGPNTPSQSPPINEIVVNSQPNATDPYSMNYETSDIPENMRYPERSYQPTPLNNNTSLANEAGISSTKQQVSADNREVYSQDMIQNGGQFMPGIFANDTFNDTSFSTF